MRGTLDLTSVGAECDATDLFGDSGALTALTLRRVTGCNDLSVVTYAELKVDTCERSVAALGELLPALRELRLSDSSVATLRDLGTTLRNLRVLWLCRSGVRDLEGASALPYLEELYLSFNDVSDLTQLALHEHLKLLDLDGNQIDDVAQIEQLGTCEKLAILNVDSNPISDVPHFRQLVCHLVPTLEQLDDRAVGRGDRASDAATLAAAWQAARARQSERVACAPQRRAASGAPVLGPRSEERLRICALGLADVYDRAVGSSGSPRRPLSGSDGGGAFAPPPPAAPGGSPAAAAASPVVEAPFESEGVHVASSVKAKLRATAVERIGTPRRGTRSASEFEGASSGGGGSAARWQSWFQPSGDAGARSSSAAAAAADDSSSLTHGSDVVFAGNAVLAMRRRRGATPTRVSAPTSADDETARAIAHLRRCAAATEASAASPVTTRSTSSSSFASSASSASAPTSTALVASAAAASARRAKSCGASAAALAPPLSPLGALRPLRSKANLRAAFPAPMQQYSGEVGAIAGSPRGGRALP